MRSFTTSKPCAKQPGGAVVVCAEGREGGQGRTGALVPDAHEGGKGEEHDAHPLRVFAVARKLPPTDIP